MVVATSWYIHKINRPHLVPLGPAERAFDIHCEPCADHVIDNTLIISRTYESPHWMVALISPSC